jgi:hypothetical protein
MIYCVTDAKKKIEGRKSATPIVLKESVCSSSPPIMKVGRYSAAETVMVCCFDPKR